MQGGGAASMRLKRRYKRFIPLDMASEEKTCVREEIISVKEAVPVRPARKFQKLFRDPNFGIQLMTVLLTMNPNNVHMERRIDTMSSSMEKVRTLTELINNTMRTLKSAAETPQQIKRLLK